MLLIATTPLPLSGCVDRLSTLHPAGPVAQEIATLWWVMLAGATAILLVVSVLLVAAARRTPPANGAEADVRFWLWGMGLAFPLVTLSLLTVYGFVLGERLLPRQTEGLVTVRAEARQWVWTFGYADRPDLVTEGVLHIPAGRPVDVEITSRDVVHSFWVPRLGGKLDAIPGHVNVLRLEAGTAGTYAGQNAEFSGRGYREHVFTVVAHDAAAWARFLREGSP